MSTATPGQVIQSLVILNQQELESNHYGILHGGYLAALAQAAKQGTLPPLQDFRKSCGLRILELVESGIQFPGFPAFKFGEKFVRDISEKAVVKISYLGDNLKEWFGDMEIPAMAPCEINISKLTKNSLNKPIMDELGDDCETGLGMVYWGMVTDRWSKDKWHFTYALDKNGLRRAVYWCWYDEDEGWDVYAIAVDDPGKWSIGHHAVSRKPLTA